MMTMERVRRQFEEAERKVAALEAADGSDEKELAYWKGRLSVLEEWLDDLKKKRN